MVSFNKMWTTLMILAAASLTQGVELPPSCSRPVYCDSNLLHHVQMARIFNDSKTFVDRVMNYDETKTLMDFDALLNETEQNPSKKQIKAFVDQYFSEEGELEEWQPKDFSENPEFLHLIRDKDLRNFGKGINDIWPILARKVKPEVLEKPEQFSLVPVTHGFIIPGGRFKEIYYWDTYWIIEGLLVSGMQETAKGMIENLIELLVKFGHIPNGSRWYYEERSQPPMLTDMVALYYKYTQDLEFLRKHIAALENEISYWLDTQAASFEKDGEYYTLLRYYAPSAGPRPESYFEDYNITIGMSEEERTDFYIDTKSAAESGWDFSSRWFVAPDGSNNGDLSDLHTRYIIPVDLNAIFAGALKNVARFHFLLNNGRKAAQYEVLLKQWMDTIQKVLWVDEDGIWYDYDFRDNAHRRYFYTSNVAPLWQGVVALDLLKTQGPKVVDYLKNSGSLNFPGGVPTSLNKTGEQWDYPNVWPPEVSIVVNALEKIGTKEASDLAFEVAQTFVRSCHSGFLQYKQMFEKYDAEKPGQFGGGGEYNVQFGFGWSNGAVLEFLKKYGSKLTADDSSELGPPDGNTNSALFKICMSLYMPMYRVLGLLGCVHAHADLPPNCRRPVYCKSNLLHHVQMARIFSDSKTFVDLVMKHDEAKTLHDFDILLKQTDQNPSKKQLKTFVDQYFAEEGELEAWKPTDFTSNPEFLNLIRDKDLRNFGKGINDIWPLLARKVKPEVRKKPDQFSLVPVTHGFIIPGGRFKEIYYWDTYWIIEGLLISGMQTTAKGMIENLIELLVKFGHIPNGSRWYYEERSQPPMLTDMVALYYKYTQDLEFLRNNIASLENEISYWLSTQTVSFEKDGECYTLLRYYVPSAGPRPESYFEDYNISMDMSEQDRTDFYTDVKSAAESGWDFSSRWFVASDGSNNGDLSDLHTRYIIPVDLNAIFAGALKNVARFHSLLKNDRKAEHYEALLKQWMDTIQKVLWNDEDGIWYDYDYKHHVHRKYFYTSNVAPLWQGVVALDLVKAKGPKIVEYLRSSGSLDFPGGVPTSLKMTGEQWDYPNVWPPEVSIVVNALENIGTKEADELAFEVAQTFVRSCHSGFLQYGQMFEKYDAEQPGQFGGGGEYNVQFGFGWSNGVVLEFLKKYGSKLTAHDSPDGPASD
ncbi:uncharacterized protein LOC113508733 [Trichoplusia ni]|uniref:Trehalase n=1 Tax=Trichoplusia ni TaxID=7111 RepID=A0A7E5X597_TRINI|nr:uncharacterized protein LOC113508733 [Trichoplusia ni]